MTLVRPPGSVPADLIIAIRNLTADEIERATGRSVSLFAKVSKPGSGLAFDFGHAAALGAALIAKGLADPFEPRYHLLRDEITARLGGRPTHRPSSPGERMMALMADIGHLADELRRATDPVGPGGRRITKAEIAAVMQQVQEARADLAALERDLQAQHDLPAGPGPAALRAVGG